MKKFLLPISLLVCFFMLTSSSEKIDFSEFFSFVGEEPNLPDEPHDYKSIEFPEHIIEGVTNWDTEPFDPLKITDNISNDGATLGRVLFYDKILSADNSLSCGSCHKQEFAFADDAQFSEGINGTLTTRNSPSLNDIEWAINSNFISPIIFFPFVQQGNFLFWDGRVHNLDSLVLLPVINQDELAGDLDMIIQKMELTSYYPDLFQKAFGDTDITDERMTIALAQFVRSMISFETKFDKAAPNNFDIFTESEMRGKELFDANCNICHIAPHFGATPANNGLDMVYEDPGMAGWLIDLPPSLTEGAFKSPSLRNITKTAPYMHDGRFETLEEVIQFYSEEVQPHEASFFQWISQPNFTGFGFDETQKADLLAFLHTLTDESFLTDEKWSDPFETVEVNHLPLLENVEVFPNPFNDLATVKIDNPSGKKFELRLTTILGQVLKTEYTTDSHHLIQKDNLENGIYLLEVRNENRKTTIRLVVQ